MKIINDGFTYIIGELFAKALPFLLLPYLSRTLGVAVFGELSFYQTIFALLVLVFGLSQDGALTRYVYVYGKRNLMSVVHMGYVYTMINLLLVLRWAWWTHSLILASVAGAAATQSFLSVQLALRQCQKHAVPYVIIQVASGILTSILTVLLLEITHHSPIIWRFVALIIGNASILMIAYILSHREVLTYRASRQRLYLAWQYIFAFGLPLILHHASGFIKGQLDRILIYQNYSSQQLGLYAAAYQIASVLAVMLMAINKATVPYYYQAMKQNKLSINQIRRFAVYGMLISPIFALLAYCVPESVFLWFLGRDYQGVKILTVYFLLGLGLTIPYYLLVNLLFYYGKNKWIAWISVCSTMVYIGVLWILMHDDIQRVPLALLISNAVILPMLWWASIQCQYDARCTKV